MTICLFSNFIEGPTVGKETSEHRLEGGQGVSHTGVWNKSVLDAGGTLSEAQRLTCFRRLAGPGRSRVGGSGDTVGLPGGGLWLLPWWLELLESSDFRLNRITCCWVVSGLGKQGDQSG